MQFHIRNHHQTICQELPLQPNLENFFIAHARVVDSVLTTYITNDSSWFAAYPNHWTNDPIVSIAPPVKQFFNLSGWLMPIKNQTHKSFFDLRYQITGADIGYTTFRSQMINNHLVSEFYALASPVSQAILNDAIHDPTFVKHALRSIYTAIDTVKLTK